MAEGADGNYGKWHYMEFTPTKADTIEPYDFWSNPHDGGTGANTTAVYCLPKSVNAAPVNITDNVFKGAAPAKRNLVKTRRYEREL